MSAFRVVALAAVVALVLLGNACTITPPSASISSIKPGAPEAPVGKLGDYKVEIARAISKSSGTRVSAARPQSMLRSVVTVDFVVDRDGRVIKSAVYRSNGDAEAERLALAALQHASPLPKPPSALVVHGGQIELMETWLFDDDGRFQLHTIALPQRDR